MLVREIMTVNPACCAESSTLDEVARHMLDHDCGGIPVVDRDDHPVGIVTDRDIVTRIVAKRLSPFEQTARDCMTSPVVFGAPGRQRGVVLSADGTAPDPSRGRGERPRRVLWHRLAGRRRAGGAAKRYWRSGEVHFRARGTGRGAVKRRPDHRAYRSRARTPQGRGPAY